MEEMKENRRERLLDFTAKYDVVCALKKTADDRVSKRASALCKYCGKQRNGEGRCGDVLAGRSQGLSPRRCPLEGCVLGVYLHACAGDEARKGKRRVTVYLRKI